MMKSAKQNSWVALAFVIGLVTAPVFASADLDVEKPTTLKDPWPEFMILPWQTLNVDPDQIAKASIALKQSQIELAQASMSDSGPLSDKDPARNASDVNSRRALSSIISGKPKSPQAVPIALTPVWASAQGRPVLMLIASTSDSNIVLQIAQRTISPEIWRKNIASSRVANAFSPLLLGMWNEISQKKLTPPKPDLAIGLAVGAVSNRGDEIERNTLNLLAAFQNLSEFTIVSPIGTELLSSAHKAWGVRGRVRRPNRTLNMTWLYPYQSKKNNQSPLTLKLIVKPSDGVFAQTIPWVVEEDVILSFTGSGGINIPLSNKLKEHLKLEEAALNRNENPQAVKVRGAWVYLDKGRAWGLRMNDRLVISDGTNTIKGHIVSYYGPELSLTSPRGWPIHEGAIMFVRKGQKNSKIGQEFSYDKVIYPTPWPPPQANVK
jgi:hypothetical protein